MHLEDIVQAVGLTYVTVGELSIDYPDKNGKYKMWANGGNLDVLMNVRLSLIPPDAFRWLASWRRAT